MPRAWQRISVNWIYRVLGIKLNQFERSGLQRSLKLMSDRPKVLSVLIVSGLGAALFEGGTMGILGLAVSVLVDKGLMLDGLMGGMLTVVLNELSGSITIGGIFLLLVGIAVIAQILKSVMLYISNAAEIYLAIEMDREIQRKVTGTIMSMNYSSIVEFPSGSMASFIEQSRTVKEVLNMFANTSRAALMFLTYGAIMIWISPVMALVSVFIVFLVWLGVGQVSKKLFSLSKRAARAKVLLLQWTVEYLNAPRLLRIFNSTETAEELIHRARDNVLIPERSSLMIAAAIKPAMEVVAIVGAAGFLILGYLLSGEGAAAAIAVLFVFVAIFFRLKPYIQTLSDLRTRLAQILPKLEIVETFLSKGANSSTDRSGIPFKSLNTKVELSNIYFQYPGAQNYALEGISFSIGRGQTVALVGSSGAGKSTIADLMLALHKPTEGHILVDSIDLETIDKHDWRERIGVVDQDVFLLNTTIEENISFGRPKATREMIMDACRAAHAQEFIESMEAGYETIIGERGYKLSGGQKQRIALARALLGNPDLLLLDEATSALDSISERLIQTALEEMHEDRTILVIAHRLSTIERADQIIVLDAGRIIEHGSLEELRSRNGKFAQMWQLQSDKLSV